MSRHHARRGLASVPFAAPRITLARKDAGVWELSLEETAGPSLPAAVVVPFRPTDSVADLAERIRAATGAGTVGFVADGVRVAPSAGAEVSTALFGRSVAVELEGVRLSVNEGARVRADGSAPRKLSLGRRFLLGGAGVVGSLVASLVFWATVLPEDSKRLGLGGAGPRKGEGESFR